MEKFKIIGTFKGKCCDADVYNNNEMLLDRELFDKLINSEEYKRAMQNRYYIGFLGHPEDPNCMDFRNACIIMTHMEMHEDGEIWGTFDLVDTPVGKVVKAFIDAGVVFGISIRGAGDVDITGKVDPDTFVFRGYDLVTFPAYDDAVPEFQAIAASSNIHKQCKYKNVCTVVSRNLSKIESCEALEIIQSQFNKNSTEYQNVGDRICELNQTMDDNENCSLLQEKLDAMTNLYLQQIEENRKLFDQVNSLELQVSSITSNSARKIQSLKRITSSQIHQMEQALSKTERQLVVARKELKTTQRELDVTAEKLTNSENKCMTLVNANSKLKDQNHQYISANSKLKDQNERYIRSCNDLESELQENESKLQSLQRNNQHLDSRSNSIKASYERNIRKLEDELHSTKNELHSTKDELDSVLGELSDLKQSNLIYDKKIESTDQLIADRDKTIADLQSKLRETVTAKQRVDQKSLNFDEKINSLTQEINNCHRIIEDYQQAYADMCASAVGLPVDNISVTGNTTPSELKNLIYASTSTSGMMPNPSYVQPEQVEIIDDSYYDDDDIVSL